MRNMCCTFTAALGLAGSIRYNLIFCQFPEKRFILETMSIIQGAVVYSTVDAMPAELDARFEAALVEAGVRDYLPKYEEFCRLDNGECPAQ